MLSVAENSRLPEELNKACKVECIVIIGLEQLVIDKLDQHLVLAHAEHTVVHVVLSVHLDQLFHQDDFLVYCDALRWLLLD